MELQAAQIIVDDIGYGRLYEDYIARGNRNPTSAVVVESIYDAVIFISEFCREDDGNLQQLLDLQLIYLAEDDNPRYSFEFNGDKYQVAIKTDNMGKNYIIY
ncbi:hypothetical protein [Vibrio harveyi]|uniref:hypothetical protein n=1 Tax=Vibrio harveyi TaxID=669 RepID=UPI003CF918B8